VDAQKGMDAFVKIHQDAYDQIVKDIDTLTTKTQDYVTTLQETLTSTILDSNRSIQGSENDLKKTLAERYVEVLAKLKETNLTSEESAKLSAEKLYLENNVSQALRDQAISYDKLSTAEQKVADFTEKKRIAEEKIAIAKDLQTTAFDKTTGKLTSGIDTASFKMLADGTAEYTNAA
jgi:hypothetical protein